MSNVILYSALSLKTFNALYTLIVFFSFVLNQADSVSTSFPVQLIIVSYRISQSLRANYLLQTGAAYFYPVKN